MDRYAKAIVGALVAGLGALEVALLPDAFGVVEVLAIEWVRIGSVTVAALGLVWGVPNAYQGRHRGE